MASRARVLRWLGLASVVILTLAIGWWAGQATMVSSTDSGDDQVAFVIVTAVESNVGRSISLNATVEQPFAPVAANALTGVVTSVDLSDAVQVGDILYTVNAVPVRAIMGVMPFYRPLQPGLRGEDVAQLQRALATLGYLSGQPTQVFDASTSAAVRKWQRASGQPATGEIALGQVIAVPRLPARLRLSEHIRVGAQVGGGEAAVLAPTGRIDFYVNVSQAQASLIPPRTSVEVYHGDKTWSAVVGESSHGADGTVRFTLTTAGAPVCGNECATLPGEERATLRAKVTLVPDVNGPSVPVAAIRTDPEGKAYVLLADGTRRDVTVLGSSGGVAVVDGLQSGQRVRLFGADEKADK